MSEKARRKKYRVGYTLWYYTDVIAENPNDAVRRADQKLAALPKVLWHEELSRLPNGYISAESCHTAVFKDGEMIADSESAHWEKVKGKGRL